jgi:hypothetical protein
MKIGEKLEHITTVFYRPQKVGARPSLDRNRMSQFSVFSGELPQTLFSTELNFKWLGQII